MPEGLEVETYRRQAEAVVGRRITEVETPDAWYIKNASPRLVQQALVGRRVEAARRTGKLLVLDLDDGGRLGLRFGMTGRLFVDGAASIERLEYSSTRREPKWVRFALRFEDGGDLLINDPRRLGGVELDPPESRLGPDAFTLSRNELERALKGSHTAIKVRLMDQRRIAGIGNLLVDEMLWRAGIDPARPTDQLTEVEVAGLHRTIVETMAELGDRGGSHTGDLRAAVTADGRCPQDDTPLIRRTIGGRTTWSCPTHQT